MTAITTRLPECTDEYDTAKGRKQKHFEDAVEARAFYAKQDKAGKNPKVIGEATQAADDGTLPAQATAAPSTTPTAALPTAAATTVAKVPGVAPNARTRAYYAGIVLAQEGHAAGVSEAMVAAVCAAYGKPNKVESEICLRNAWHAVRGFAAAGGKLPKAPQPTGAAVERAIAAVMDAKEAAAE